RLVRQGFASACPARVRPATMALSGARLRAKSSAMKNKAVLCVSLFSATIATMAAKPIALVGGRLIDGFGGPPLANSVILLEGERIKAIGQVGTLIVPNDAEVISTEGMDVLPGLWDCHVHTMLLGHSDYTHWDKTYPKRLASEIMPAAAHQLLMAGV